MGAVRDRLGADSPTVLLILGNDDERIAEREIARGERDGLWRYLHREWAEVAGLRVAGYGCVPPTPFLLKDFERYDVSRFVDPGSVSPEAGRRTVDVDPDDVRFGTIRADLERLVDGVDPESAVLLCHAPPYRTALDRAALDGRTVDHVPLDVHVGSIALRRLIESWQPRFTLHGHVHECVRLTGRYVERLGRTVAISAAHDGPETAVIVLDPDRPAEAQRILL
jgi:Icc-related predicted phosphoesterase